MSWPFTVNPSNVKIPCIHMLLIIDLEDGRAPQTSDTFSSGWIEPTKLVT
jgi:hypothetical protein